MRRFSLRLPPLIAVALLGGSPWLAGPAQAGQDPSGSSARYFVFEAPGAAISNTRPVAISAQGAIAGTYIDAQTTIEGPNPTTHGFVRSANGHFDEFDAFGPCTPIGYCITDISGINFFGLVTGSVRLSDGFIRLTDGNFVRVTVPGAINAQATGINAYGTVTGYANFDRAVRGFVRTLDGSVTLFDAPGTDSRIAPAAINLYGSITGNGNGGAFVRDPNGNITTFQAPGSAGITSASSISLAGSVAGIYNTGATYNGSLSLQYNGFVRQADGTFIEFAVPGSLSVESAIISPTGAVAGRAVSATQTHGYIRAPDGTFTVFDPPGSQSTGVSAINAFGVVTGTYSDANSQGHAYVRVPAKRWRPTAGE